MAADVDGVLGDGLRAVGQVVTAGQPAQPDLAALIGREVGDVVTVGGETYVVEYEVDEGE